MTEKLNDIYNNNIYFQNVQKKYSHLLINEGFILKNIHRISKYNGPHLSFGIVSSDEEWRQLGIFRLQNYNHTKSYMLNEINENGLDQLDDLGTIYAAWLNNEMIASIRLCRYPFESNVLLQDETLKHFLGHGYRDEYLEWTRLLIKPHRLITGLLPAIITYAGMRTLANQSYHKYFGYSTMVVKRLFSRFQLSNQSLAFTIPKRGTHQYTLLKGDFAFDFLNVMKDDLNQ